MRDGRTAREHVRGYARRDPIGGAAALADVTPGPVPIGAEMAVEAWETLSSTRGAGMSGPAPISLRDAAAYSDVFRVPLTPREAQWVLEQDAEFVKVIAEIHAPAAG